MQLLSHGHTTIVGNAGGPYKTLDGAMNIHQAGVHRIVINDYIHAHGVNTTLSADVTSQDTSINVVSVVGFSVGNHVHLGPTPTPTEFVHPQITDIIANEIFLDRPIDSSYAIGANISQSIVDMATAVGTLAAPIVYRYYPIENRVEHITQINLSMDHATAGADDLFGGISALKYGVVFRARINGQIGTFTNWKRNGDIKIDVGPEKVSYAAKSGPGAFGTSARGSFSELDSVVVLDAANGDFLEILIQDDLAGITNFRIKAQGHVEGA